MGRQGRGDKRVSEDNWKNKRTRQQHFTTDELEFIRAGYKSGRLAKSVAFDLKCSTRVIHTRFADFRSEIPVRERGPSKLRHYSSSFDLDKSE